MGNSHDHSHGPSGVEALSASGRYVRRLWYAVALGLLTFVVQIVVALSTSSLALLADSAHVFTDVFGVLMAVTAITVAQRARKSAQRTFGLHRGEVFAALFNAVLLFGVAGWVLYEAVSRLAEPPEVPGVPVILVAIFGLAMNLISMSLLREGAKESLNVRGAYLEVLADMLGSVGVLLSGVLTLAFGWRYADPMIGVAIGLFVLPRAFTLGRRALRILFQHAPEGVNVDEVTTTLKAVPGVHDVHDLHIWTLTSGMDVVSVHVVAESQADTTSVGESVRTVLAERFELSHSTVQTEAEEGDHTCPGPSW